jgi:outer membrane receptor protein involved in Fe transport
MRRSGAAFAAVSLIALAAASPVLAQTDSAPTDIVVTAQKRVQSLQDVPVVVTAVSKQLLQDAGVKDIKDLTVVTPGLMVTSTSSEASTTARIRGVGTVGDNLGLESSVGVVIDGVYRPRNSVGFGDLGELQRIEVLKGPQGTLFGKNTSAGVINILTQRPSFRFGAEAEATVSNFNGYGGSASVTGPLIEDKVAARLYVADRQRDGFYKIKTGSGPRTRSDDQNQDYYTIRGQVLVTPNNAFDVNFIGDYTKRTENCCAAVQIYEGATAAILRALDPASLGPTHGGVAPGAASAVSPYDRVAYSNRDTTQNIEDKGLSAEANWKTGWLGNATLTSITAYREWIRTGQTDPDYSSVDILYYDTNHQNSRFKQFSQELRLAGHSGQLDWLVGGFYANEELIQNTALRYGSAFETYASLLFSGGTNPTLLGTLLGRAPGTTFVTGQGQQDHYDQNEDSLALFTNNTFHITDKLELTGGLRYTHEHKTLDTLYFNTDGGLGCLTLQGRKAALGATATAISPLVCGTFQNSNFNNQPDHQSLTEEKVTGTVKLAYRWNKEVLTYASYARGYKAGGFNLDRLACGFNGTAGCGTTTAQNSSSTFTTTGNPLQPVLDTSFKPEFVDSYELGIKNTLFDRTLLLNATAFYQKYSGFQLNAFNGLVFTVVSVPEVISQGVDADFVWAPAKGLTFVGGVTYADTRYSNKDTSALGPKCTSIAYGSPASAAVPAGCSLLPGNRLSLAPLVSASLSITYERPITDNLVAHFNVASKFTSSYNTGSDLNPVKMQNEFALFNGRVGISPRDGRWSFELWGQNLLNQRYYQVAFDATAQSGTFDAFLGQPRTYGATLRIRY